MLLNRDRLHNALQALKPCVDTRARHTLPILQYVKLTASIKDLQLQVTNMELAGDLIIPSEGGEPWSTCVPYRELADTVKATPKGVILELTFQDEGLAIKGGGSSSILQTHPGDNFPAPFSVSGPVADLEASALDLKLGSLAVSRDATKPTLSAVLLHMDASGARLVSTDGFRLAVQKVGGGCPGEAHLIVPKAALGLLEGASKLTWDGGWLRVMRPGETYTIRLVSGNYPSYEKVLPNKPPRFVTLNRKAMIAALKAVSVKKDDYNNNVQLFFDFPNLRLNFRHPDKGTAEASLGFYGEREAFSLAFNVDYLMEVFAALKDEEVIYQFTDEIGQGQFVSTGFRYVLMPVRYANA